MVFWFFGYPGVGKDYCAQKFKEIAKIPYLHGDDFLNVIERKKLLSGTFTSMDRLNKLRRIVKQLKIYLLESKNIVIADSLPDNASREFLISQFKDKIVFIYVKTPKTVWLKRLEKRGDHFFTKNHAIDYVKRYWQEITIEHEIIDNGIDEENLEGNILKIYNKYKD